MRILLMAIFMAIIGDDGVAQTFAKQNLGIFGDDAGMHVEVIHVEWASMISIETMSYAGGVASSGDQVAGGGFMPVISLFDQGGDVLQVAEGGRFNCGDGRRVDSMSGFCWDAQVLTQVAAGDYILVLSQDGNLPAGAQYADGFTREGQPGYTGEMYVGDSGVNFVSPDGIVRSGHWFLQYKISAMSVVPEVDSGVVFFFGLLVLSMMCRRDAVVTTRGEA